jgi:hypothetical protein
MELARQRYTTNGKNRLCMNNYKIVRHFERTTFAVFLCTKQLTTKQKEREALQRAVERNTSNIVWDYFSRNLFVVNEFWVDLFSKCDGKKNRIGWSI